MMRSVRTAVSCGILLVIGLSTQALAQGHQKAVVPPEFEKVFRHGLDYVRGLEHYSAAGTLRVHSESGDTKQDLEYILSMAKKPPDLLTMTVTKTKDKSLVGRLLFTGSQGRTSVYLPRETALAVAPSTLGEFPDTLTLAMVMTLYEYLEYSKPDRWLSRIGVVDSVGTDKTGDVQRDHLKFSLSNYFTLRDFGVEMWLDNGDEPLLERLNIDMSKSLEGRGFGTILRAGTQITMELSFDTWTLDAEPASEEFDPPGTPKEYEIIDMTDILMANNGARISHASAPAEADRAGLLSRLMARPQMPTASERAQIIAHLKEASPAERAELIDRIKASMSKSGLARPQSPAIKQNTSTTTTGQDAARLRARMGR